MELLFVVVLQFILVEYCQAVNTLTARVVNGVSGQQSPCLGQDVVFTCTFPPGQFSLVDMIVRGEYGDEITLTLTASVPIRAAILQGNTMIANLTSSTSAELLIVAIYSALNRSTVTCEIPGESPPHPSVISVLGSASGPVYTYDSIAQISFESISVVVQRPDYGWECVDMYTAVAQSNRGGTISGSATVTKNTRGQAITVVHLSGLDLCRNTYSFTTFATSDGSRGQNFTLQGPYPTNPNVLSNVVTSELTALPLTTRLSWSLESAPQPPDCVANYSLSFSGNRFITSNTSVLPNELLDNYGFPFCINQPLKISPVIPVLGDIDSSSTTVMIRVEEGFKAPQEVTISMLNLYFDHTTLQLRFSFRLDWNLAAPSEPDSSVAVGFAICSGTCIASHNSNSRTSHTFFSLDPQQFIGVPFRGCVTLQRSDCTGTNESVDLTTPIAITASSLTSRGQDGFETNIRKNPNFAVSSLQVMLAPGDPQYSIAPDNGDVFTLTVFGLKDGINYSFSIQALDSMNNQIGIPLTGSYSIPRIDTLYTLSISSAVAITFVVTAAISVTLGLLIGSLITYCFLKKRRMINMGGTSSGHSDGNRGEESEHPAAMYEEVTTHKQTVRPPPHPVHVEQFEMGTNAAYGSVHS